MTFTCRPLYPRGMLELFCREMRTGTATDAGAGVEGRLGAEPHASQYTIPAAFSRVQRGHVHLTPPPGAYAGGGTGCIGSVEKP